MTMSGGAKIQRVKELAKREREKVTGSAAGWMGFLDRSEERRVGKECRL